MVELAIMDRVNIIILLMAQYWFNVLNLSYQLHCLPLPSLPLTHY